MMGEKTHSFLVWRTLPLAKIQPSNGSMKVQAFACEVLDKLPASFLKLSHINRWIFSKSFSQVFASEFAWSRRLETTHVSVFCPKAPNNSLTLHSGRVLLCTCFFYCPFNKRHVPHIPRAEAVVIYNRKHVVERMICFSGERCHPLHVKMQIANRPWGTLHELYYLVNSWLVYSNKYFKGLVTEFFASLLNHRPWNGLCSLFLSLFY